MEAFEQKMKADGCNDAAIAAFKHNYDQLVAGADGMVPESTISPVTVRC
jgi:UTP--glucose-1-phosphate uridylyltransferase/phosphoglucomutase